MDALTASLPPTGANGPDAAALLRGAHGRDARSVARQFEGMLIGQMLAPMFETVEVDEQFGGGFGEEMFRSLMVENLGQAIAAGPGIGLAEPLTREILRLQEAAQAERGIAGTTGG